MRATAFFFSVFLSLTLASCGDDNNSSEETDELCYDDDLQWASLTKESGIKSETSDYRGFFFKIVDSSYTSSKLMFNDFASGELYTVLAGEAGDSSAVWAGDRLFFFNRSSGNSNYRILSFNDDGLRQTCQKATPGESVGDPHAVLALDEQTALITYGVKGQIVVLDTVTGEIKQELKEWNHGDETLNAFSLAKWDDETILVPHQGLSDDYMSATNNQSIYVLTWSDGELNVSDQDSTKAGNQGFTTSVTIPQIIENPAADTVSIFGLCGVYSPAGCVAGHETLSRANGKFATSAAWTIPTKELLSNGPIAQSATPGVLFAATAEIDDSFKIDNATVSKIDLNAKSSSTFHTFPEGSSGYGAIIHDQSTKMTYIGDAVGEEGTFTIYSDDGNATTVSVTGRPTGGVLVK